MAEEKVVLIDKILNKLYEAGVLGFLINEIDYNLSHLNIYKLKNILDNLEEFVQEILKIQSNYIKKLKI